MDTLQRVLEIANERTKPWYDAADRAEIRSEPATAIFYRNIAWEIENGREWLDDVTVVEPLAPRAGRSSPAN
jgi:hypothetical protein